MVTASPGTSAVSAASARTSRRRPVPRQAQPEQSEVFQEVNSRARTSYTFFSYLITSSSLLSAGKLSPHGPSPCFPLVIHLNSVYPRQIYLSSLLLPACAQNNFLRFSLDKTIKRRYSIVYFHSEVQLWACTGFDGGFEVGEAIRRLRDCATTWNLNINADNNNLALAA